MTSQMTNKGNLTMPNETTKYRTNSRANSRAKSRTNSRANSRVNNHCKDITVT